MTMTTTYDCTVLGETKNMKVETSDSVTELQKALADLQADLANTIIEKKKEGFGYNYETLPQLLAVLRPLFVKTGLSVVQMPTATTWENGETSTVTIVTRLTHASGEYMQFDTPVPVVHGKKMNVIQEWGATFTYAQRYILKLLFNVAASNDTDGIVTDTIEDTPITMATGLRVQAKYEEVLKSDSEFEATLSDLVEWVSDGEVDNLSELTEGQGLALLEALENRLNKKVE